MAFRNIISMIFISSNRSYNLEFSSAGTGKLKEGSALNRLVWLIFIYLTLLFLTSCATAPTPVPAQEGVIVTFRVENEEYKIRLTDPADIENARKLLAGEEAPNIPNGVVVRGDPDVNVGYSWHIDPDSVEICDGRPSDVEKGAITSERYCPWSAEVIAIEE
jgi:hypothetical protein